MTELVWTMEKRRREEGRELAGEYRNWKGGLIICRWAVDLGLRLICL
jgi:hypothetical protein